TFIDKLNSLSHGAMYYFRAYAENSGGGDWADSTASFATEALIAPTVIVSSATDITVSTATLHGEVTDIGADYPLVTFYYGDDDAGEVAGSWDHSVSVGMKSLIFSTDIVGLAEETTYYYRTFAENSAGSDWSDVAGFVTASSTDIALDAVSSDKNNDVTLTWSHTLGGGTNRVVVVGVGIEEGGVVISSVTFDGELMTLAPGSLQVEGNNITAIYYILDADLPSAGSYDIVVTTDIGDSIGAGAVSLENVKQAPPEAVTGTTLGRGNTYIEKDITTLTDGAWIVDVAGSGTGTSFTPGGSQDGRFHINPSSSTVAGSTRHVQTAGTVTNSWTAGNDHRICLSMAAFAPI
ncbi:MAG: hypothetical protein DRP66_09830, partial [Planctomycetota bacterium]